MQKMLSLLVLSTIVFQANSILSMCCMRRKPQPLQVQAPLPPAPVPDDETILHQLDSVFDQVKCVEISAKDWLECARHCDDTFELDEREFALEKLREARGQEALLKDGLLNLTKQLNNKKNYAQFMRKFHPHHFYDYNQKEQEDVVQQCLPHISPELIQLMISHLWEQGSISSVARRPNSDILYVQLLDKNNKRHILTDPLHFFDAYKGISSIKIVPQDKLQALLRGESHHPAENDLRLVPVLD